MSERPMTVGEVIDFLSTFDRSRIVLIQDWATRYSAVVPCIINASYMKKVSEYQFTHDENGDYCAVVIG